MHDYLPGVNIALPWACMTTSLSNKVNPATSATSPASLVISPTLVTVLVSSKPGVYIRRSSSSNNLQQGERDFTVLLAVDVSRIVPEQLVQAIGYL